MIFCELIVMLDIINVYTDAVPLAASCSASFSAAVLSFSLLRPRHLLICLFFAELSNSLYAGIIFSEQNLYGRKVWALSDDFLGRHRAGRDFKIGTVIF